MDQEDKEIIFQVALALSECLRMSNYGMKYEARKDALKDFQDRFPEGRFEER